jgi:hypothetical protein
MRAVIVILTLLLAACAASTSSYQKTYKPSSEISPDAALVWLAEGAQPDIVDVDDLGTELEARRAQGYLVVGFSQFSGPVEGDEGILAQARDSRATLVLKSVLEAGEMPQYRRVYDRDAGVVYLPVVAEQDKAERAASSDKAPEHPEYATVTVYRQTALFLAKKL